MDGTTIDFFGDGRLERLLGRLGYLTDPDYRTSSDPHDASPLRHSLDTAFERIGVAGALCPRAPLAGGTADTPSERRLPVV